MTLPFTPLRDSTWGTKAGHLRVAHVLLDPSLVEWRILDPAQKSGFPGQQDRSDRMVFSEASTEDLEAIGLAWLILRTDERLPDPEARRVLADQVAAWLKMDSSEPWEPAWREAADSRPVPFVGPQVVLALRGGADVVWPYWIARRAPERGRDWDRRIPVVPRLLRRIRSILNKGEDLSFAESPPQRMGVAEARSRVEKLLLGDDVPPVEWAGLYSSRSRPVAILDDLIRHVGAYLANLQDEDRPWVLEELAGSGFLPELYLKYAPRLLTDEDEDVRVWIKRSMLRELVDLEEPDANWFPGATRDHRLFVAGSILIRIGLQAPVLHPEEGERARLLVKRMGTALSEAKRPARTRDTS